MKIIYGVYKNADMTEGRGPMVLQFCVVTKEIGDKYIDKQPGVMGTRRKWSEENSGHWEVKPLPLYEDHDDVISNQREQIKEQALKKLTALEREVLGL